MGWQSLVTYFLISLLFKYAYTFKCTQKKLGSLNSTLLNSLIDPVRDQIPVFNATTVPNLDSFIEKFTAGSSNEDIHLNITQILTKYGYENEKHESHTQDGYILDIFRIPGNGPIVFIMHGVLSSSDDFVTTGTELGLPYLLADLGYEVWLGNARGNVHGRKHVTLSPDCAEFWQFTWDEIARYDLPAMIDYILKTTNQQKLAYIGHSQGTTSFFVMASEIPEYNDKISVMIALSAVSYLSHTENIFISLIARITKVVDLLTQAIGLYEFVPRNQITDAITSTACGTPVTASIFCENIMFFVIGTDYAQANATVYPAFFGHFPGGAATKQLVHYGQLIVSGRFCQYDHGVVGNIENYGALTPPDYPLEKIKSKVAIFHSDKDYFSTEPDRAKLIARLPNLIENYRVPFPSFNHMDFLLAKDVRTLAYNKLVDILEEHA